MRVEISGLTKRYGSLVAVDDIDLVLEDEQLTTLVGPSGCGKTTTLRCIAGLERPESGTIKIGDEVVMDAESNVFVPPQKRDLGFIFQSFNVWPHLSVFDNVAYPLRVQDYSSAEIEEKVDRILEITNIEELRDKNATNLSGGQQKRVSICRALVSEPSTLLCDEPLTGLDRNLRKQMRRELKRIQKDLGITTIYVTHSQPEAMSLSDQICLMNTRGKIEQTGDGYSIYNDPASRYAFDFFGNTQELKGTVSNPSGVETDLGTVQCDIEDVAEGNRVLLGWRPENVELATEGKASWSDNTWRGEITLITYQGDHFELVISVNGEEILAKSNASASGISEGQTVDLHVPPQEIKVFTE